MNKVFFNIFLMLLGINSWSQYQVTPVLLNDTTAQIQINDSLQGLQNEIKRKDITVGGTIKGNIILKNANITFSTTTSSYGITFQDGTSMVTSSVGAVGVVANPSQFTGNGTALSILNLLTSTVTLLGPSLEDAEIPDTITLTNITQITNRSHTNLSDIGSNTHAQIDSKLTTIATDTTTLQANIDLKVAKAGDTMTGNLIVSNSSVAITGTGLFQGNGSGLTSLTPGSVLAGLLGSQVIASSIAVNTAYPGAVQSGTYGIGITGNAGTVTNGLYTTTDFSGDVTGNYNTTVVGNDSHNHTASTLSGVIFLQNTLQSGATFYVSSGTIYNQLLVNPATQKFTVNSDGIGFGTLFPNSNHLQLEGSSTYSKYLQFIANPGIYGNASTDGTKMWQEDQTFKINNQEGLSIVVAVGGSTRLSLGANSEYLATNVQIGSNDPTHALHVTGGIYATSSITANAGFYGDGSNLTGITAPGDNLGSHIATMTLTANYDIISTTIAISTISVTSGLSSIYISTAVKIGGYTLPFADGTANYVLKTDGSGTVSWAATPAGASISAGDSNVSVTDAGDGYITFTEDNSERMRITGGNVGIGVTSPLAMLHVGRELSDYGTLTFNNTGAIIVSTGADQNASRSNVLTLMRDGTGGVTYAGAVKFDMSKWEATSYARTQLDISMSHGATQDLVDVLSLRSSGGIGIGTTNPTELVHLYNNQGAETEFRIDNPNTSAAAQSRIQMVSSAGTFYWGLESAAGGGKAYFYHSGNYPIYFATNSTERMRIKNDGLVGVGISNPTHKLHVSGNAIVTSSMSVSGTDLTGTTPVFQVIGGTMTVLANGNVGIGTTGPAGRLHVRPPATGGRYAYFGNNDTNGTVLIFDRAGDTGVGAESWNAMQAISAQGVAYGNLVLQHEGGFVGIGVTAPLQKLHVEGRILGAWPADGDVIAYIDNATLSLAMATSDRRLKKNIIQVTEDILNDILKIPIYKFNAIDEKDTDKKRYGVMAQDLLPLFPELVYTIKNSDKKEYYGVHHDKLPVVLLKAIQEQQVLIENLKTRIEVLEAKP